MGFTDLQGFQSAHKKWIEASLQVDEPERESHWSESIAVGSKSFTENVKKSLGFKS
jgi:putative transposase